MTRDVPFDENAMCDICGKLGAFDFMGDFFCSECIEKHRLVDVPELDEDESE